MRGDVPRPYIYGKRGHEFSPRARGCSDRPHAQRLALRVFPACAGMFLDHATRGLAAVGFPRVRGDVPSGDSGAESGTSFSPRARGCSYPRQYKKSLLGVFPACAGMFLLRNVLPNFRRRFPRVRGDVPCSHRTPNLTPCGFPRVRGDVPNTATTVTDLGEFSPRARGCSAPPPRSAGALRVFPACAGMFLVTSIHGSGTVSFPRVRGDVPDSLNPAEIPVPFSPRARGCSFVFRSGCPHRCVFPACAGMFPSG